MRSLFFRHAAAFLVAPMLAAGWLSACGSATPPPAPSAPPPVAQQPPATPELTWRPTPDAEFRAKAPEPGPEREWLAPVPQETRLSNGIRVLLVPREKLPVVAVQVVSRRGADQQALPGLGTFVGAMLEQGTTTRSALEISDAYVRIGAEHGASVDWDSSGAWIQVLSHHLDEGLEVLADVVQNPAFDDKEVERVRSQRLAMVRQQRDMPHVLLFNSIARTVFPRHPYGEALIGTEESLRRLNRQGLRAFYQATFAPRDTSIIVVGDVRQAELLPKLEKAFGTWKRAAGRAPQARRPPPLQREVVIVDLPGASQSNIALATVGVERRSAEFAPILMANTILGGMFSSRLNLNLREKNAFTYGARSYFDMRHGPGPFAAMAAVDTPNTGRALAEMLTELNRFCTSPVTSEEISLALGMQVKSMPGRFDTNEDAAESFAKLAVYDLPLDEYRTRPERLAQVTPEQVMRVANERLDPSKMKIIVVGDRKVTEEQLKGLRFGPIVVVDHEGKVVERVPVEGPYRNFECGTAERVGR